VAEAAAETLCSLGCKEVTLHHHGLASRPSFRNLGQRTIVNTDDGLRCFCWPGDEPPWEGQWGRLHTAFRRSGPSVTLGHEPLVTQGQSPGSRPLATRGHEPLAAPPALAAQFIQQKANSTADLFKEGPL